MSEVGKEPSSAVDVAYEQSSETLPSSFGICHEVIEGWKSAIERIGFRRPLLLAFGHPVQHAPEQPQHVDLVVIGARREDQHLVDQGIDPRRVPRE